MRFVAAGFTTALLVFAVATAISEMSLTSNTTSSSDTTARPKSQLAKGTNDAVRSSRGSSRSPRKETATQEAAERQTLEYQRQLSSVRQREAEVQAKQDALKFVFEEIREEQRSVDLLRRQVSEEIAALREAATRVAQRDTTVPGELPTTVAVSQSVTSSAVVRPIAAIRDQQSIRDIAVLVNRLVKQGNTREAILLLRRLKDRDSTKVLTELSATNLELALQLSDDLLASREDGTSRR